ncbi:hypothetical protein Golax_011784 [Gossypium laxum]|uniref:Uncharacterized protein n=1 Tax=Gossypium laxum TaxID=34288 RepID=A0A7J8ZM62_9ROSI|nr:hypothetical protein [Gossypium laxum]
MENELTQLTINEEEDAVIQIQENPSTERIEEFFQLVGCFLTASIIHFPAIKCLAIRGKRGVTGKIREVNRGFANGPRRKEHRKSYGKAVDLVLGFNLEGGFLCDGAKQVSSLTDQGRYAMDHDLEDVALVGEEGKKKI